MNPLGPGDPLRLGPYRLFGVLGEGGMGKVYVGRDSAGVIAAVKVLRPELSHDTHLAQRFVREAHAAQAVRSKGVAMVLGAQTEGGRPWIATEYLAGLTLDEAVDAHGPFDEVAVRALAVAIARTLIDIHAAGFIHRDLKPANIVLTAGGPRIIDFGIARPEHGLTLTTTGQAPVSPGYGAPEQVLGQRVTPSADVFSLGAVLVYAGSGRPAYEGPHVAAVQYEVVHGAPRLDGLPAPLQPLVAPCLAGDPAARPAPAQIVSACAAPRGADRAWRRGPVAAAIKEREEQVRTLTTLTTLTTDVGGTRQGVSRRRLLTGLAASGTVLAAGGTAGWLYLRKPSSDPFAIPPAARTPMARKETISKDGADEEYWEPKVLWAADKADTDSPALLPVRDVVVFGSMDGGIAAYDVRKGDLRWTAREARVKGGYLSLSDRLVAAVDAHGTLRTYVASTGEPKWTCDAEAATLLAADATAVYLVTKDGRLRSVRRSDARIRWTAQVPAGFREKLGPSAAVGKGRLVMGSDDGNVLAVDTANGRHAWDRQEQSATVVRPVIIGDTVCLNGLTLSVSNLSDGTRLWSHKAFHWSDDEPQVWGAPVLSGLGIYATNTKAPSRLSTMDGKTVWENDRSGTSPMLCQGDGVWWVDSEYMDDGKPRLRAGHVENGKEVGSYTFDESQYTAMAADGNRVFFMNDHTLFVMSVF